MAMKPFRWPKPTLVGGSSYPLCSLLSKSAQLHSTQRRLRHRQDIGILDTAPQVGQRPMRSLDGDKGALAFVQGQSYI
jgi:hypothetical protein